MLTMVTENRQQRKLKPIGCDFDGDVVCLPRYRNPVRSVVSMRHVLQTFLASGIALVPTETDHAVLVIYSLRCAMTLWLFRPVRCAMHSKIKLARRTWRISRDHELISSMKYCWKIQES
ncbi:hypothetical protein AVEN_148938-1 [Araneus ventricosus]|uniref:Uncharacterized protein n=1 Tax=Araneus ventricosus TaxID=182803 RepID=A0A4Y2FQ47_ARAVE|nr:hypothetical protein AVEN_148938-1 [Araneus ventricosus]